MGLSLVGLQGSGSLLPEACLGAQVRLFLPRVVNDGFGTVRMCVAVGVDANVYTCFSVGGTGMNGVIDRLFFNTGSIEDPRVVLIVCFSPGGSCWSFCPAALSLLCGYGAAWSSVLEARTCLLSLSVFCFSLGRVLAFVSLSFWSWGLPPSWAGDMDTWLIMLAYLRYVLGPGVLVIAAVPGGVEIRGSV